MWVFGRKTRGKSIGFSKRLIPTNFKFVKPSKFAISILLISILLVGFSTIFLIKPAATERGIKVDNTQYSVYVGHPAQVKITGKITGAVGGNVILTITKPDGTSAENMAFVTKTGDFTSLILLDKNSQLGQYQISASYNGAYVGSASFDVTGKESQQTTTPQSTTGYKTYQNTEYGFSIKHPSWWQEQEVLEKTPQGVLIAVFAPSKTTILVIAIAPNDKDFEGLQGQEYLNKMIESQKKDCKPPSCSNFKVADSNAYTHVNGYLYYALVYSVSQRADDGTTSDVVRIIAQFPDGKDTWLLLIQTTADDLQQHLAEISSVTSTFTIFDYQGEQKQFQLYAKASQKNGIVYLIIKNPKDSSDDIYSIKLTTVNGKITNFIKIKDWTYKRLGPDSIMYQTTFSPLDSSDMIKVKLKVDSKNTEIQWEAFTKDQKSLGTGKVGTS